MSHERMKKDFELLARERLEIFVKDMFSLHAMADLEEEDAVQTVIYGLLATTANVIVFSNLTFDRDNLIELFESLLRTARRRIEQIEREAKS